MGVRARPTTLGWIAHREAAPVRWPRFDTQKARHRVRTFSLWDLRRPRDPWSTRVTTIVVTGASGIAGAHILRALRSRGLAALPISRSQHDGWFQADLTSDADVRRLPAFGVVIHCAALT